MGKIVNILLHNIVLSYGITLSITNYYYISSISTIMNSLIYLVPSHRGTGGPTNVDIMITT